MEKIHVNHFWELKGERVKANGIFKTLWSLLFSSLNVTLKGAKLILTSPLSGTRCTS